jgi:hypothetical protein
MDRLAPFSIMQTKSGKPTFAKSNTAAASQSTRHGGAVGKATLLKLRERSS